MFLIQVVLFVTRLPELYPIFSSTVLLIPVSGMRFNDKILNKLYSCGGLSLAYQDIILGFFKEEIDLINYIVILGKSYLWTSRCKDTKPSLRHFKRVSLNKYHTEKYISLKSNNINFFRKKWRMFEEKILFDN